LAARRSFKDHRPVRARTAVIVVTLAGAAAACSPIRDAQGYIADPELMAEVKPGVDTKASVLKTLGRPSLQTQWDDRQWYYYSRKTTQIAFRKPRPQEQTITIISFDAKGNVSKVDKQVGLGQVASIEPVEDKTKTMGKDRSFWDAVFGNIGQVGTIGGPGGGPDGGP